MTKTNPGTSGIVFNIQRYSIHDGPGIRTTIFLKGCDLRCFWCQNPESQTSRPEILLNKDKCSGCGLCLSVCPAGASILHGGKSAIKRKNCIGCGHCAEACPNDARKLTGQLMTADMVMEQGLKDAEYYENSCGGITISGGEPLAQPAFCLSILRRCKEEGVHTALDTCGFAPWQNFLAILKYTDLVLFDIKHLDSVKHMLGTGKPNALILENAKKVADLTLMRIRVPLIPGFNDRPEDIGSITRFVKSTLGASIPIDLLPYNDMAGKKYEMLDRHYTPAKTQDDDYVESLRQITI